MQTDASTRGCAVLLAENAVIGALGREPVANGALDRVVGIGYRGSVGLGRDVQIDRTKAVERDGVSTVSQVKRERQVGGQVGGSSFRGTVDRVAVVGALR